MLQEISSHNKSENHPFSFESLACRRKKGDNEGRPHTHIRNSCQVHTLSLIITGNQRSSADGGFCGEGGDCSGGWSFRIIQSLLLANEVVQSISYGQYLII